jgi:hypothetical protein
MFSFVISFFESKNNAVTVAADMQLENRAKFAAGACSWGPLCGFCRALVAGTAAAFGGGHRGWMLAVWGVSGELLAFNGGRFA